MRKILFVMVAALAFVSCEKYEDELGELDIIGNINRSGNFSSSTGFVTLSQYSWRVDREKGGTITIETDDAAFVETMGTLVGIDGVGANYNDVWVDFYKRVAPLYIIKYVCIYFSLLTS